MIHMTIDGRDIMLNAQEAEHWMDTGCLERKPDFDALDPEYCQIRDRMIANGDACFYQSCCPPSNKEQTHA